MKLYLNKQTMKFAGSLAAVGSLTPHAVLEFPTDKHGLIEALNNVLHITMAAASFENKKIVSYDDIAEIISLAQLPEAARLASNVFDRLRELTAEKKA